MAEEELIAGCRQKDQKAFKVLYNQYAGLLYGIAIRYASNNKEAVVRTINELNFQASILDKLGLPQDHTAPMNIHVNASPTPIVGVEMMITSEQIHKLKIKQLAERFYANLQECNDGVRNRLTIENEDKSFCGLTLKCADPSHVPGFLT